MYRIIGADKKEYGPVSEDQIRQWLTQGRASLASRVKREGSEEWVTLGSLPEFASFRAGPPVAGQTPQSATPASTSGMAVASLVLSFFGICLLPAVVSVGLGIAALSAIKRSQGRLGGGGLAIAGIAISGVMLLLALFAVTPAMVLPSLAKAKQRAQRINCVNNVKQINLALRMYADANGGHLPPATNWCDAISVELGSPQVLVCPSGAPGFRAHYGFNAALAGVDLSHVKDPANLVMIFETDGGWNEYGGKELMAHTRHPTTTIGFADGHIESPSRTRWTQIRWDP